MAKCNICIFKNLIFFLFFKNICLDGPHLTNEHRTHHVPLADAMAITLMSLIPPALSGVNFGLPAG